MCNLLPWHGSFDISIVNSRTDTCIILYLFSSSDSLYYSPLSFVKKTLLKFLCALSFSSKYCLCKFLLNSSLPFPSQANFASQQIPSKISLCIFLLKQFFFSTNSIHNFFVPFPSQADFISQQILSKISLSPFLLKQILLLSKFLRKLLCAFSFLSKFFFSANSIDNFFVPFPSQADFVSQQILSKIPLCFFLLKQILFLCKFLRKFLFAFSFSSKFCFSANFFENFFVPFPS